MSWYQEIISWDPKRQEICLGSKSLSPGIPGDRRFTKSQEIFSWDPKRQDIQHYTISIGLGLPIFVGCQGVRILTGSFLM